MRRSLREQYNAAAAEKRVAAGALVAAWNEEEGVGREELASYVDQLGEIAQALDKAEPEALADL